VRGLRLLGEARSVIHRVSVIVLVLAGIAAAAEGSTTSSLALRVVSAEDVDSLDPALASSYVSLPIVSASCSRLFEFGPDAAVPRPEVAVGLPRVSADGRTYTFTIRRGFRFSDGREVTAANFASRRLLKPR
jgi:peptide/nickel transport system substrate-binding protein